MAQVFPRWTNGASRLALLAAPVVVGLMVWAGIVFARSSYGTNERDAAVQPIPFSHKHHAGELAIDCRYCHTNVEQGAFAGMPDTKTCMNCHSQMWVGSQMLEPVRASYRTGQPLTWHRVYNLPGYVYFDHHVHIQNGIGCSSCHGRVDRMPFTSQEPSLLMQWCLDCHRDPAREIRPRSAVFQMDYERPDDQASLGAKLVKDYHIRGVKELTSCSTCHR